MVALMVLVSVSSLPALEGAPRPASPGSSAAIASAGAGPRPGVAYSAGSPTPTLPTTGRAAAGPATAVPAKPLPLNWTQLSVTGASPPSLQSGAMVYDPIAKEYIVFGGAANGSALGETWTFANGSWTDVGATLSTAPSARWYFAFVWDAADSYALLFGGRDGSADFNDTWAFNGTAWQQLNVTGAPPVMTTTRYAYDAADGYVWVFGGCTINNGCNDETWSFVGGVWTNRTSTVAGAPSSLPTAAVYDSSLGYVLLYGGNSAYSSNCSVGAGYTWKYVGGNYTNLTATAGSPTPPITYGSHMLADVPAVGGVVLYGGWDGPACAYSNQTWVFDGGQWYNATTATNPGPLWDGDFASDSNATALLFSGNTIVGSYAQSGATWSLTPGFLASIAGGPFVGVAPLEVNATATLAGIGPFSTSWSWGDGSLGNTTANASHTYLTAGNYTLSLTARDAAGNVRRATTWARVYAPLTADPTVTPVDGDAPLRVAYSAGAVGGVPPLVYAWRFGDGGASSSANGTHTYSAAGNYTWDLNVTDRLGHRSSQSRTVEVAPTLSLVSALLNRTRGIAPLDVGFSALAVGGAPPLSYTWSFGDGSPNSTGNVSDHTYASVGSFSGALTVRDQYGGEIVHPFTVQTADPLTVQYTGPATVDVAPLSAYFSAAAAGGFAPYSYSWSFGTGGASANGSAASYVYSVAGTYLVRLTTTDAAGDQVTTSTSLVVVAPLAATLAYSPGVGVTGVPIALNLTTVGGYGPFTYAWSFGDGSTTTGLANESHTYERAGTFRVSVAVSDSAGEQLTEAAQVTVALPLVVDLVATPSSVTVGATFSLQGTDAGGYGPFTIEWSGLPDGCPNGARAILLSCNATAAGTYNVTLWVNDSIGEHRNASTTVAETPVPTTGSGSTPSGVPPWLWVGVAIVVVAAVAGLLLVWGRRRRSAPSSGVLGEESAPSELGSDAGESAPPYGQNG